MKKVAFICVHNSCRSQMAEGFAKLLGKDIIEVYSAGSSYYPEVKPLAVTVMNEVGIDMASHHPKLITEIPQDLDIVITMGCEVECPYLPSRHKEDWGLSDPSSGPIADYRKTRDLIKTRVEYLIERIKKGQL